MQEIKQVALLSSLFYMHSVAQHEEEGPAPILRLKRHIHKRIGLNKADREKELSLTVMTSIESLHCHAHCLDCDEVTEH